MKGKLEISVDINAEKILRAECEFHAAILKIAAAKIDELRNQSFVGRHNNLLKRVVVWVCAIGVALIVVDLLPYGYCKPRYLQDFMFFIFFVSVMVLLRYEDFLVKAFWNKLNSFVSDTRTEATFKMARRLVPFEARYVLEGNRVSYIRVKDGIDTLNWSREISGEYYLCGDFVITYKKKQLYPDIFIFVGVTEGLTDYLADLGVGSGLSVNSRSDF